jgi:hypothetical protein
LVRYNDQKHFCITFDDHQIHKCTQGEEGSPSCTPSKDFQKYGHKIAMKHEKEAPPAPPPRLSFNPKYSLKIIWKRLCLYDKICFLNFIRFQWNQKQSTKTQWAVIIGQVTSREINQQSRNILLRMKAKQISGK